MFDRQGCGKENYSREEIENEVEQRLSSSGWNSRSAAVVLDPELEIWVWSNSPHVKKALGWQGNNTELRDWLIEKKYLQEGNIKPGLPKEAMEEILKISKKPRSSSIYSQLAEKVSLKNCTDPSFIKLTTTLKKWFST